MPTEKTFPRFTTQPKRRPSNPGGKSMTDQDSARATDVNVIMAQYRRNGTLPSVSEQKPLYGDFTGPDDLQNMQMQIQLAEDRFRELPADVRTLADNDEVTFLRMFDDPDQRALLESAGLTILNPSETTSTPQINSPTSPSDPPSTPLQTPDTTPDAT